MIYWMWIWFEMIWYKYDLLILNLCWSLSLASMSHTENWKHTTDNKNLLSKPIFTSKWLFTKQPKQTRQKVCFSSTKVFLTIWKYQWFWKFWTEFQFFRGFVLIIEILFCSLLLNHGLLRTWCLTKKNQLARCVC